MTSLDRRRFLGAALLGAGAATLPFGTRLLGAQANAQTVPAGVVFDPAPFTLGVASGDPTPESVILWTRLAPEPLVGGGALPDVVEVDWVVAEDPRLRRVVTSGTRATNAEMAHSVHIDASGLEPGRTYWYRFAALGRVSRIGRTRTAPVGPTSRLRFGFVSCQNFEAGFYSAYRHLATEDLDFVVHLGDYIYEGGGAGDENGERQHTGPEIQSITDYRNRHALYKGDPALRAAHAAFPWIVTWDDHEVDNNYADLEPEDSDEAEGNTPEGFPLRRAAAYQGYYEHMPIRLTEAGPPSTDPTRPDFRIYRQLIFGDLLDMSVLDTRQYRTDQPCVVPSDDPQGFELVLVARCPEQDDPDNTIMGVEQRDWLKGGLSSSTTAWRCVAQQLMVGEYAQVSTNAAPVALPGIGSQGVYFGTDAWDGYRVERADLLSHIVEQEIPDTFVITGDIHSHWVHDLKPDFGDPDSPIAGSEFVGTSITSSGFSGLTPLVRQQIYTNNPHIRFFEGDTHGYAVVDVTPDAVTTAFKIVGDNGEVGSDPFAPIRLLSVHRQSRGNPASEQLEGGDGSPRGGVLG